MANTTNTKFSTSVMAITGLITAIGSIITILFNVGIIGNKGDEKHQDLQDNNPKEVVVKGEITPNIVEDKGVKIITKDEPKVQKKAVVKEFNLTGRWVDINNPTGRYEITHDSSGNISFTEYSLIFGEWIATAEGSGEVNSMRVNIPYTTYVGTNGKFTGKITNNGKKIDGQVKDFNAGITAELKLQKQ